MRRMRQTEQKPDDEEQYLDQLEWRAREMSRTPDAAREIASFDNHIDHSPGLTWEISCTYSVVPVSEEVQPFALLVLVWDDNWGRWNWEVQSGVQGAPSFRAAGKFLMAQLTRQRMTDEKSSYNAFLRQFI